MSDAVLTAIIKSFFQFMMVFCICGTITESVGYVMTCISHYFISPLFGNNEEENDNEN